MSEADEEGVVRLLNCNFPHVGMTRRKLRARMDGGAVFLVAVSGSELVGFADVVFGRSALLRGIAVKESFRGKGVGPKLVLAAAREAAREGRLKIRLKVRKSNSAAIKAYEEAGFFVRREDLDALGEPVYLMEKRLAT